MTYWHNCVDIGTAICAACVGRRLVVVAGGIELCPACGGQGRGWDGQDREPAASPDQPLPPLRAAAVGLFLAVVGWPALRFIDSALQVFLAYVI